jgi:hypothetical protein
MSLKPHPQVRAVSVVALLTTRWQSSMTTHRFSQWLPAVPEPLASVIDRTLVEAPWAVKRLD